MFESIRGNDKPFDLRAEDWWKPQDHRVLYVKVAVLCLLDVSRRACGWDR